MIEPCWNHLYLCLGGIVYDALFTNVARLPIYLCASRQAPYAFW